MNGPQVVPELLLSTPSPDWDQSTPEWFTMPCPKIHDGIASDEHPNNYPRTTPPKALEPLTVGAMAGELHQRLESLQLSQQQLQDGPASNGWSECDVADAGKCKIDPESSLPGITSPVTLRMPSYAPPPQPVAERPSRIAKGHRKAAPRPQPSGAPPLSSKGKSVGDIQPVIIVSLGSIGHPLNCGKACKYARRKDGCTRGAVCSDCHICNWQRKPRHEEGVGQRSERSLGSRYHPNGDGQPCNDSSCNVYPPPMPMAAQQSDAGSGEEQ